jgi:hypothetical protein
MRLRKIVKTELCLRCICQAMYVFSGFSILVIIGHVTMYSKLKPKNWNTNDNVRLSVLLWMTEETSVSRCRVRTSTDTELQSFSSTDQTGQGHLTLTALASFLERDHRTTGSGLPTPSTGFVGRRICPSHYFYLHSSTLHIYWPPLWSSGQSALLQIHRSIFDSRRYQIFWEAVGLELCPLSLLRIIEGNLEEIVAALPLEIGD